MLLKLVSESNIADLKKLLCSAEIQLAEIKMAH
jgi:hypothetical protein